MFVVSAQQVVDGTHYEPQCKVVQAMMTPTASPTLKPTTSVTPAPTTCNTDKGATDLYGDACDGYYHNPWWCGDEYDDDDFTSDDMCCACGGGGTQIVTPTPTLGSSVWTSAAPTPSPLDECVDTDNGAVDLDGDGCDYYVSFTSDCGGYDDDDFSSDEMCCACDGDGRRRMTDDAYGYGYGDGDGLPTSQPTTTASLTSPRTRTPTVPPTATPHPTAAPLPTAGPTEQTPDTCMYSPDFESGSFPPWAHCEFTAKVGGRIEVRYLHDEHYEHYDQRDDDDSNEQWSLKFDAAVPEATDLSAVLDYTKKTRAYGCARALKPALLPARVEHLTAGTVAQVRNSRRVLKHSFCRYFLWRELRLGLPEDGRSPTCAWLEDHVHS